jgi:dienelactone hydrolase
MKITRPYSKANPAAWDASARLQDNGAKWDALWCQRDKDVVSGFTVHTASRRPSGKLRIRNLIVSIFFGFSTSAASAQVTSSKVEIPVVGSKCNERVREVTSVWGDLRIPIQQIGPLSAVVLLHSNAGIVGVGDFYAKALNFAGIATLEVDSYTPRGVRNGNDWSAPVLCDRLQDAWGALSFLAKDGRFNSQQIGVAGFSSGGAVAIMVGMGVRPRRVPRQNDYLPKELVYSAHFALYPGCANIMDDRQRIRSWINPGRPQNWGTTGKPIHIVSGTADDFDFDPKVDCLRMSQEFPEIANQLSVRMIDGATHGFDWPNPPPTSYSSFAKAQTGGVVTMRYSPFDSAVTQKEMVDFFKKQ